MKPPVGRKLIQGVELDYTLSKMQDQATKLREELMMLVSIVESFQQDLGAAKRDRGLPAGSYNVRGEDAFFEV